MKRIAKCLISALLLFSLALAFVSCEQTPEKLLEKAEKKLENAPYTVEISYDYSCNDKVMEQALKAMEDMDIVVQVDGEDLKMDMDFSMSTMGVTISTKVDYVAVDGILYASAHASAMGQSQVTKQKATIPPEEMGGLTNDLAGTGDITFSDFETVEMVETEDGYKITCSGISEDALAVLTESTKDQMSGVASNVKISFGDIKLFYEVEDGKIDTMVLSCTYTMNISGTAYQIDMRIEMDYDYDQPVSISAPADADKYTEVTYSDMMG